MKTALLLEKLEGQLATLRQRCAPVSQFATLSARFDRHLFRLVRQHYRLVSTRRAIIWLRFVMQLSSNSCRKWHGWRNIWRHNWKPSRVKPPPVIARVGQCTTENCPLAA